jgi:hypothetical protein
MAASVGAFCCSSVGNADTSSRSRAETLVSSGRAGDADSGGRRSGNAGDGHACCSTLRRAAGIEATELKGLETTLLSDDCDVRAKIHHRAARMAVRVIDSAAVRHGGDVGVDCRCTRRSDQAAVPLARAL